MHVISERPLREFWAAHLDAEKPLQAWLREAKQSDWEKFADVRERFPGADLVGKFTVFNIGGNKYRLITVIDYNRGNVYVRRVLTHAEYDRGRWKSNGDI
jgi:mRNA interferase HigB